MQPLIGISPRAKAFPTRTAGLTLRDVESELGREKERSRKLQQDLIRTEAELLDLKMDWKMKHLNRGVTAHASAHPSAPPAPTGPSPSESFSSSDNNADTASDEEAEGFGRHVVAVDVHHAASSARRDFSFTESLLQEIDSQPLPPFSIAK